MTSATALASGLNRATGQLSFFVQADLTDDPAISEDLGPYMISAATEDSAAASEEQAYYGWT